MSLKAMSDYTFTSKYPRYLKEKKRRETWSESVNRVRDMHIRKYPDVSEHIEWAFEQVMDKRVLGSQRALQFGGLPIERKNARMYNCLSQTTEFITSEGVRSFRDFNDGDEISVMTHIGRWKNATVRSYGERSLNRIVFGRGNAFHEIHATENHRWFKKDGSITEQLEVGDSIMFAPNTFGEFDYDSASTDERLYWIYGYVFGDGTTQQGENKQVYSSVRLCGDEVRYECRFKELGFKTSSSHSLEGDLIAYTGKYGKTLPDPKKDDPRLIRAFVRGYLDADGIRNSNARGNPNYETPTPYDGIQATGEESIRFIRECFPIAGIYIVSEEDLTDQITNYGPRTDITIRFRIINGFGKTAPSFKVTRIDKDVSQEVVWCLEVEDDHSFVLPFGMVTGNCCVSFCDRVRFFQEAFWLLLCGCGTGFSVQTHHIDKLPDFHPTILGHKGKRTFVIPDTIEGWSDALGILLSTYLPHPEFLDWEGYEVEFDYSEIRLKGSVLASGVGKAPGPEPLKRSLEIIRKLLNQRLMEGHDRLRSIDAYDILMHASDAVLSGGVRRSATICLFSPHDLLMLKAKTGNWFVENPQRARSNNSVLLIRGETSRETFYEIMESVKEFGEPGFVWSDSTELVVNPCVEIGMWPVCSVTNVSGWQMCNLCEINGGKIKSIEDWRIAAKAAAIIGTLQAGYTEFAYLGSVTEAIVKREALLGVSITGMMDNPHILFDADLQREMASLIVEVNAWFAPLIGINPAARCTCVKPAGTTSCLLCTGSGIHAHHARNYLRHMQGNELEAPLQYFKLHNEIAVEDSVWSANKTDKVIAFCITVPETAKTKNDVNAVELLKHVRLTQQNWVEAGKVEERCTQPWLSHNVSNTINVSPHEWDEVAEFIYDNRDYFAGVSLLPSTGDRDYPQAPMVAIKMEEELFEEYGSAVLMTEDLVSQGVSLFGGNLWTGCDIATGLGSLVKPSEPIDDDNLSEWELYEDQMVIHQGRNAWVQLVESLANKHLEGNVKKACYLLKDLYYLKKWTNLQREYIDVDYSLMYEESDETKVNETIACGGGQCEI